MNQRTLTRITTDIADVDRTAVRFRVGVITDTDPLSVALGGSDAPLKARSVTSALAVDDRVSVLTFAHDLLVIGRIVETVDVYGVAIPAASGWASAATFSRIGRLVVLQGDFSKTSGTPAPNDVMGTLPTGARPPTQMNPAVTTQNGDVVGTILIQTDGDFVWRTGSTSETDHTAIDGIAFVV